MAMRTSIQMTTPELTFFSSFESQQSPDNIDCVWSFNLVMYGSMKSTVFRSAIEHMTRRNKF